MPNPISSPPPIDPRKLDKPVSNPFIQRVKTFCGRIWNHVTNLPGYLADLARRISSAVDTFFQTAFQDLLEEHNVDEHIPIEKQDEVPMDITELRPTAIRAKRLDSSKPPTLLRSSEPVHLEKTRQKVKSAVLTQIAESYYILDAEWSRQNPRALATETPSTVDYKACLDPYIDPYMLHPTSRKQVDVDMLHAQMLERANELQVVDRIKTPLIKKEAPGVIDVPGSGNCFFCAFIVALSLSKTAGLKESLKKKLGFEIEDINQLKDGKLKHKGYLFGEFPQELRTLAVDYLRTHKENLTVRAEMDSSIVTINSDIHDEIANKRREITQLQLIPRKSERQKQQLLGKQESLKQLQDKLIPEGVYDRFLDTVLNPSENAGVALFYALSTLFKVRICIHAQARDGGLGRLMTTKNFDLEGWPIIRLLHTNNHFKVFDPDLAKEQTEIPLIPQ